MVERKEDDEFPFWEPCLIFRGKTHCSISGVYYQDINKCFNDEGLEPSCTLPFVLAFSSSVSGMTSTFPGFENTGHWWAHQTPRYKLEAHQGKHNFGTSAGEKNPLEKDGWRCHFFFEMHSSIHICIYYIHVLLMKI